MKERAAWKRRRRDFMAAVWLLLVFALGAYLTYSLLRPEDF